MKITICMGSRCTLMGAESIYDAVEYVKENICGPESKVCLAEDLEIELSSCKNYCKAQEGVEPIVIMDGEIIYNATAQEVSEKLINKLRI